MTTTKGSSGNRPPEEHSEQVNGSAPSDRSPDDGGSDPPDFDPTDSDDNGDPSITPAVTEEPGGLTAISAEIDTGENGGRLVIPDRLPILPIRDSVAFPGTIMPLQVNRTKSRKVLDLALAGSRLIAVVAQRKPQTEDPRLDDLYRVGTACAILKMLKVPDGPETILVHGLRRVGLESITHETEYLEATVHSHTDPVDVGKEIEALMHIVRSLADRFIHLSPNLPDEARQVLFSIEAPGALADFLGANLPLKLVDRQELIETFDVTLRLQKVHRILVAQLDLLELSAKLQRQVQSQVDHTQREYFLREQLKAIQEELGEREGPGQSARTLRERIQAASMPPAAEQEALKEADRLEHIPQASPEHSMVLDYVEWLVELPWSKSTEDKLDLDLAERILNEDHYGLEKVKRRILEFLAVRRLKSDSRGPILCFAGPPGVGKTSLGQSIARAMGRNFIRVSLGGIRDEATIRGHRRTYIGAMPGRIIREIRRAGSNNPLFMLDEVDKIGQDVRGDPMSALLEVLDPAQNSTFSDHYIALPFDLSRVLFIGTANYMAAIEPALRDRMEIIELPGYTHYEKLKIAERHLVPRQLAENGLTPEQLHFDPETLSHIISDYTREAGVRALEREIGSVCRARAAIQVRGQASTPRIGPEELGEILGPRQFESEVAASEPVPGVVTGLAFTPTGGEILFIEASTVPGSGQLRLTGQLGEIMRESAHAAGTIIRARAQRWKFEPDLFGSTDVHVHVPAGAVPKDGPSAGVAILTAMLSAFRGIAIDPLLGMTGEITLSGRILPVGGIREKILAAHRAGLKRVILPRRNEKDLNEIPQDIRRDLTFCLVDTIDAVLDLVSGDLVSSSPGRGSKPRSKPASKRSVKKPSRFPAGTGRRSTSRKTAARGRATRRSSSRRKVG